MTDTQLATAPRERETTTPMSDGAAFIDGEYVPIAEARIPILDWGFLRSDATYDVVSVWDGRFFRLEDHLDRFERSVARLRMKLPYGRDQIRDIVFECVRKTGLRRAYVEIVATRGMPRPGSRDPRDCQNQFFAFAIPFVWIADPETQDRGLHLVISNIRRIPPESVDPTVKNYHWMDLMKGIYEAYDRGGETVVLVDENDNVTEGPGFNIFVCKDGRLTTPARGVLEGITRKSVIELAKKMNVDMELGVVGADEVRDADEVFLSTTAGGVLPVTRVDGQPIGDGAPGPVTLRMRDLYWEAHEDPSLSSPVDYG
jgi:branched-chain amino acid aminotransferase